MSCGCVAHFIVLFFGHQPTQFPEYFDFLNSPLQGGAN